MNKLPDVLPEDYTQRTAMLLVFAKTKLGRHVPEYAKAMVIGKGVPQGTAERAGTELFTMLSQMRSSIRSKLFSDHKCMHEWFHKYINDNPKSMGVIVYNAACAESVNRPWDPQLYGHD